VAARRSPSPCRVIPVATPVAAAIAPGLTDTPMTRAIPGHIDRGREAVPQGALVAVNDVAALAVHLMSDDARSVTGSVFTVDAGRTAV
jgi:3-oxoacyl-[acyl-carrier protein] reductase